MEIGVKCSVEAEFEATSIGGTDICEFEEV